MLPPEKKPFCGHISKTRVCGMLLKRIYNINVYSQTRELNPPSQYYGPKKLFNSSLPRSLRSASSHHISSPVSSLPASSHFPSATTSPLGRRHRLPCKTSRCRLPQPRSSRRHLLYPQVDNSTKVTKVPRPPPPGPPSHTLLHPHRCHA
jgi:hypothetical protein